MAFTGIALSSLSTIGTAKPRGRYPGSHPWTLVAALAALGIAFPAATQAQLRCDLQVKSTPGVDGAAACLDLVAVRNGGTPIQTAGNATRISTDGFRLCKTAFEVSQPAGADIVFIYDNSGSMTATYAHIDSLTRDTTFLHASANCGGGGNSLNSRLTGQTMIFNTLVGPDTVQLLSSATGCTGIAGDPYQARGRVITQGVDFLQLASPTSTAGVVGFASNVEHPQPPLVLTPANAQRVKDSVVLNYVTNTIYVPPLQLATTWLNDTAITNTARKAIIFLSDGEPNDAADFERWLNANLGIPIYSIALGDSGVVFQRMQTMSQRTGGGYFQVPPNDIGRMNQVMQQIIQAITVVNLPTSVEISNGAFAPPMVSRSVNITRNPDSSVSVALDSIIALKKGQNPLTVKVTMSPGDVREYPVTIQADGAEAGGSTTTLECHRMPSLVMLNQNGGVDSDYPSGPTQYDVRLVRTTSDLAQVVVTATSKDSTRPGWGDEEFITLPQTSTGPDSTVNRREDYAFNGGAITAAKGDNTLQAAPNGQVILTWRHPRDERESAVFILPGRKIPTTPGFIDMVRVTDVPKGVALTTPVTTPVVIRGVTNLVRSGDQAILTTKGFLTDPVMDEGLLNPNQVPTFIVKTASHFSYKVSIYDHLGQFMNSQEGKVDSTKWSNMRANADSMAVAISILPVAKSGQQFGTGVYIMRATLTTMETVRTDPNAPKHVTPTTKMMINRFGYTR